MHRRITPDHHDHEHHHHHVYRGWGWRRTAWFLAAAALVVWAVSGIYIVEPSERAIVWRFGRILPEPSPPGIHFGLPFGLDRVSRLKMYEQKRVGVGRGAIDRDQGRTAQPRQAECLAGDRNLIEISAIVQYEIIDAKAYLIGAADVSAAIENLATATLSSEISSRSVDDIFTVGRLEIQQKVLGAVRDRLAQLERHGRGIGVQINSVTLETVGPPQEVEQAFRDVIAAREDRQRIINEAQGYAAAVIPTARGESQRIRLESEGSAVDTREKARSDADRFNRMLAELAAGRELTITRLVLETFEEVLPRLKKIVVDDRAGKPIDLGILESQ